MDIRAYEVLQQEEGLENPEEKTDLIGSIYIYIY